MILRPAATRRFLHAPFSAALVSALVFAVVAAGIALVRAWPGQQQHPISLQSAMPTLIASADGPFVLDSGNPLEMVLRRAERAGNVTNGRRILLLRHVTVNRQPGVLFQVYLGAVSKQNMSEDDAHFVGTFNVFRARPAGADASANEAVFESWDVTAVLERLGSAVSERGDIPMVVLPIGPPDAGARVTIGRVELVAQ